MWLTGNKIEEEVKNNRITIRPYNNDKLNSNSYNYSLSSKLLQITDEIIDLKKTDNFIERTIPKTGLILKPGECYLGTTQEFFGSNVYASLITGRSSIGRKFITNHITAGLIDQGFFGRITLEITVVKPTRVYPEIYFGQIFWYKVFGDPLLYEGKYQSQKEPTISRLPLDFS